jgi:hypothetical protein
MMAVWGEFGVVVREQPRWWCDAVGDRDTDFEDVEYERIPRSRENREVNEQLV